MGGARAWKLLTDMAFGKYGQGSGGIVASFGSLADIVNFL